MSGKLEKTELVNDLISINTIMEEIWRYHPDNKDKVDIVESYAQLVFIKDEIETELEKLDS
jgi:hypothetical protein|tara:strand:+ start:438 stop:620 length:183 start_codon:yes stop_codon:yes gene_type:complete